MSTALQNATINAPATFSFKDAKLNAYSTEIAKIGADMAQRNVELAKVFGKIKTEKCYEADGFKSVAEYAEKTFGVKRAMAYQLANVGERFYNQTTSAAKTVTAMLTPANLAEISGMTDGQINHALKEGKISEKSTQKDLRELAKSVKDGSNIGVAKIEKQYDGMYIVYFPDGQANKGDFKALDWDAVLKSTGLDTESDYIEKTFIPLTSKQDGVRVIMVGDAMCKITYHAHVKEKTARKNGPVTTYTVEQLKAMLEQAMQAEQEAGE